MEDQNQIDSAFDADQPHEPCRRIKQRCLWIASDGMPDELVRIPQGQFAGLYCLPDVLLKWIEYAVEVAAVQHLSWRGRDHDRPEEDDGEQRQRQGKQPWSSLKSLFHPYAILSKLPIPKLPSRRYCPRKAQP